VKFKRDKNTNQYIKEVAYYLQNAKSCLNNALNSEEKSVNKQQIQNIFKGVEGLCEMSPLHFQIIRSELLIILEVRASFNPSQPTGRKSFF